MSSQDHPPPPPVPPSPPNSGGVRRHHTISASSRTARASAKEAISEESQEQALWNDDEVVDEDWVGGVGAVGEKTSLHRQSSLPTRYHRGIPGASRTGNLTPKTVNSLAAIAGHEGDEEPWNIAGGYAVEDEHPASETGQQQQGVETQAANSPLSPHFANAPSPPPATSNVRRHVSLTYGAGVAGPRKMGSSGLRRSGTLQASTPAHSRNATPPDTSERVEEDEYGYEGDEGPYEDEYTEYLSQQGQGQQYATTPLGPSGWTPGNDWRSAANSGFSNNGGNGGSQSATIDEVQRALSALEIASNNNNLGHMYQAQQTIGNYQAGQSSHPPRFNPTHPPPPQAPGVRNGGNGNNGNGSRKLDLAPDLEGRRTPQASSGGSNYMQQQQQYQQRQESRTPSSRGSWDQKDRVLGNRASNQNLQYGYQHAGKGDSGSGVPNVPSIPQQYLQQQPRMTTGSSFSQGGGGQQQVTGSGQASGQALMTAPIDVPSLIAAKGYNPGNFDIRPTFARYFVIKSYTEDDVHKSLKYEIWSSTDPGNKRLDKAFKETAGRGPIYLFFSVNASGHFCGMAEMLTPVDYTRSSTVWASDKWKGVFKVRWIFVRDIPNVNLRHIKLNNTQERKPVTNSRDTQELLPDAGQEMLRIFYSHPARTSLLQDFAFYELQAIQKVQTQQQSGSTSPSHSPDSAAPSPQLHAATVSQQLQQNMFGMSPTTPLAYQLTQMTPMMQMQMQMNMGMGMGMGNQFGIPQSQAMQQSVMRHASPGTPPVDGQGFMSMSGF